MADIALFADALFSSVLQPLAPTILKLLDLGIDVIPLHAGTKNPIAKSWARRGPISQWSYAISLGKSFNLGVRCGGKSHLLIVDCENFETYQKVVSWLEDHGITDIIVVHTCSGEGYHIWLKCKNRPRDSRKSYRKIASHFGQGEVRFDRGAQTAIPPSVATSSKNDHEGMYVFEQPDALDRFAGMPEVEWETVIAPLITPVATSSDGAEAPSQVTSLEGLPLNLLPLLPLQRVPRFVDELIGILQTAPDNQPIPHPRGRREPYATRSEGEQAIVVILLLCGFTYQQIFRFFEHHQPAHFREHPDPRSYFDRSYRAAVEEIILDPARREIAAYYFAVKSAVWPFQSYLARRVYLSAIAIAWRQRDWSCVMKQYEIQQMTHASKAGISEALDLLESDEYGQLLSSEKLSSARRSTSRVEIKPVAWLAQNANLSHMGGVLGENGEQLGMIRWLLGEDPDCPHTLVAVLESVSKEPKSASEIARRTGMSRNTVSARLAVLEGHGLVENRGRGAWVLADWQLVPEEPLRVQEEDAVGVATEQLELISSEGVPEQTPVEIYVSVMRQVYGVNIQPGKIKAKYQEDLAELKITLEALASTGRIPMASLYQYVRWVAVHYRQIAEQRGWPFVWVHTLSSFRTLTWYQEEYARGLAARRVAWPHIPRPGEWSEGALESPKAKAASRRGVAEFDARKPDDPVVARHNDGWVTRRAGNGQHYLDREA